MDVSHETTTPKVVGIRRLKEPMPRPSETIVFTVANQKGGVGKTTSAVNIAAALAMGGLRTLVIDLDPQGNASTALNVKNDESTTTIYSVIADQATIAQAVQRVVGFPALECVPGNAQLAGAEVELVPEMAREYRLKYALDAYLEQCTTQGERIDYVFIDCPPSLGLLTTNALVAADQVLVPIQCEYYSLEGLVLLQKTLSRVQRLLNPKIRLTTMVLTMFDSRTRLSNDVADDVRRHFPIELIDTPIPRAVRISEAPSVNQTVMTYDPTSPGAVAYMAVAREIAERGTNQRRTIQQDLSVSKEEGVW